MKIAMILAAGRGERLKPITDKTPKALCMIQNIPLIEYHIANLVKAGYECLIINHAYLGGKIRHQIGNGSRWGITIHYSPEPPGGLETGGGIVNALPWLGHEPFLTVNADIFTDYDFSTITLPRHSSAHLVLVNKPIYSPQGDFGLVTPDHLDNAKRQYTFAGIAVYQPEIFHHCKPGRYSITPLLRELATKKEATAELYLGRWMDIGSEERLALAQNIPQTVVQ